MSADYLIKKRSNTLKVLLGLGFLSLAAAFITQYDPVTGLISGLDAMRWVAANFYPNEQSLTRLPSIMNRLRETVLMSIAATTVAAFSATFFALLGAQTTKVNDALRLMSRSTAAFLRNIPAVAWAMILLFTFGQSSLTGFLALFFSTFGFLSRVFMETFDETTASSIEALTATGASYMQIIFQAVLPASLPQMISWMLYMVETNIRDATLLGILTGTGIGFSFALFYKSMNYHAASLVVIVIVVTILVIEYISNHIRRVIL
ncbi:MAG: Phosphate-import permease protein PhnE [Firmicutes bacterium]|nr:Phosphate-import permease protein PhnE [Bacillota bacterium]MBT9157604.1 Phosphate-import permease protein PhnE [Bacillota bacterium]